jgi:hypothetical protein
VEFVLDLIFLYLQRTSKVSGLKGRLATHCKENVFVLECLVSVKQLKESMGYGTQNMRSLWGTGFEMH